MQVWAVTRGEGLNDNNRGRGKAGKIGKRGKEGSVKGGGQNRVRKGKRGLEGGKTFSSTYGL